jgi:UDP-N-acetylmuramoyl-L-alanyl-D-glutamate--2,6-diaminopimelate ligase
MRFSQLIQGVKTVTTASGQDPEIRGLDYDSRRVREGFCFVAMRGDTTDGNLYIDRAIEAGAVAVISDSAFERPRPGRAWAEIEAGSGRRALAQMSAHFFDEPAKKLKIVGVTGTNGKTTTTFLVEAMLAAAGRKSALLGTIEYRIGDRRVPAPHTTPEALELAQFFADAARQGASEAVMEVSSHALHQQRTWGIPFDVAIFTNLTRDHLDYHRDMESYFASKRILFSGSGTPSPRVAVINQDNEYGRQLLVFAQQQGSEVVSYGLTTGDFHASEVNISASGTKFTLRSPDGEVAIASPLVGTVNVYNILGAAAAAVARGCSLRDVQQGVANLQRVPGRFERVSAGQPFTVVVDYAHTDDALRNLTSVARDLVSHGAAGGRVITIFGCGGDRDRSKRPKMAMAAAKGSDFVILTSDNPRSENPLAIIKDALAGFDGIHTDFTIEPDRERAIELGFLIAQPNDIVLIAGKGHEKIQIIGDRQLPFDDVQVASQALAGLGHSPARKDSAPFVAGGTE